MGDDEHVQVPTYVPATQRQIWREEAASMDMSQAEYVRTMVQAGRRSFDLDGGSATGTDENPVEPAPGGATPGVEALKDRILKTIERQDTADWDALLAEVTGDVEERLQDALNELVAQGRIQHIPRENVYEVMDGGR